MSFQKQKKVHRFVDKNSGLVNFYCYKISKSVFISHNNNTKGYT